jgi:hypothetical protein
MFKTFLTSLLLHILHGVFHFVTNDHEYVLFIVITNRSFPHSWLITWWVTRVTRRVSHVKQELLTLPKHLSSSPDFSEVRVSGSLVFCVVFCRWLFVLFILAIVLSVLRLRPLIAPFWYLQTFRIRHWEPCNCFCLRNAMSDTVMAAFVGIASLLFSFLVGNPVPGKISTHHVTPKRQRHSDATLNGWCNEYHSAAG